MQVYSGSKMTYLPSMMTLYQQCIRALQNNIDCTLPDVMILMFARGELSLFKDGGCFTALYEIGGVPFEILEPVLERCTPEQLLRIEEYNPVRSQLLSFIVRMMETVCALTYLFIAISMF